MTGFEPEDNGLIPFWAVYLRDTIMNDSTNRLGAVEVTGRGFEIIRFVDRYGKHCSLQQSSLAEFEPPGTSAVWLGIDEERMHLDREQTQMLINHLSKWLESGSFSL